jgi:para-nitrobenzyl esterase
VLFLLSTSIKPFFILITLYYHESFFDGSASTFAAVALSACSVTIDAGTVDGGQCTGRRNAVFYKAIPYAEPPSGWRTKFRAPEALREKFSQGKIDATVSVPTYIQFS